MLPKVAVCLLVVTVAVAGSCMVIPAAMAQSARPGSGLADYGICRTGVIEIPAALRGFPQGERGQQPTEQIEIEADEVQSLDDDRIQLDGDVRIIRGGQGIFADRAVYNKATHFIEADGNVRFYTINGDELEAQTVEFDVTDFAGVMRNARIRLADSAPAARVRARATASSIEFTGGDHQVMNDVALTNCAQGDRSVELIAKRIELDHVKGIGTGRSMTVKFKQVPIFYLPVLSFPIDDRRKTGFLFPGYGYDQKSGLSLEFPYYVNISPRFDATIRLRIFKNRGLQLYGEYRYLSENFRGDVRGEFLPSDEVFGDRDRYAYSVDHAARLGGNWEAKVAFKSISDRRYLYDFSDDFGAPGTTWMRQTADLYYYGDAIDLAVETSAYERVNDNVSSRSQPYERLPGIQLSLKAMDLGLFRFAMASEYTRFTHDDGARVEGSRLRLEPRLSLPIERSYGHFTPQFSLHSVRYNLTNNPVGSDSPAVTVPVFSVDSGLIFERFIKGGDQVYRQTLEPRLFYARIPERLEQEGFPDFDTGVASVASSFAHLFRENRFFGGDRVGDTHQIALGLTSRIVEDSSGKERFRIRLGQVYYLDDRKVGLAPDSAIETGSRSGFLLESAASLNQDWSVRGVTRWSADQYDLEYLSVSAGYHHSRRKNAALGYRWEKDAAEDLSLKFNLPVSGRWQFDADVRYTLQDSELRRATLGISYDGCCWLAKLEIQRYPNGLGELENRFMVVFELGALLGRTST